MSNSFNVWTVLWTNGEPYEYCTRPETRARAPESRLYGPDDVVKFRRLVHRVLPGSRFRCLSNVDVPGVDCIPLTSGMVGWWPKMELFRPDLPQGRNIYFDLDTLPLRGIHDIASFPAPFAAIKPGRNVGSSALGNELAKEPWPSWRDHEGFWRVPKYQTSVMAWDSEYGHRFWQAFTPAHKARLASDQDFLGEVFPNEARMPTGWFTKIGRCSKNMEPPDPIKVVLTMPYRNDEAARRFKWASKVWP